MKTKSQVPGAREAGEQGHELPLLRRDLHPRQRVGRCFLAEPAQQVGLPKRDFEQVLVE